MTESFRQLRHVLALYEHRNYRRAAEAVHLTQSALSVSIRRIEDEYGVPLFIRDQAGVQPTEYGEVVVRLARETGSTLAEGRREIELLRNLDSGKVIVGSDPWMADIIVAPALSKLLRKHSKLRFRLRSQGWDELQGELLARRIDVYVGSPFDALDPGIEATTYELSSPVILCRREHPLTRLPEIRIRDVLPYPLLVPKLPRWYLLWLAEHYGGGSESEGLHDLFLQTEDFTVIRHIVHETDAITAGVVRAFPAELSPSEFAMLDIVDLDHVRAPVMVATLAERPIPAAAAAFISEVTDEILRLRAALDGVRARRLAGTEPG
ncbi:LysR family transcriptional regulator [Nevskia sp.]|uniref:LysR family transcriptional regulator n=1 Tax=Nevskia sp. TaxID=1929292 RepID=UPI003F6FB954